MRSTAFLFLLLLFAPLAGATMLQADKKTLTSADGQRFVVERNAHGAVMTSVAHTVYLGKDCDAYSRRHGRGQWSWANGGVLVTFAGTRIGFPGQEVDVPGGDACKL